jgi:hypothetical protein
MSDFNNLFEQINIIPLPLQYVTRSNNTLIAIRTAIIYALVHGHSFLFPIASYLHVRTDRLADSELPTTRASISIGSLQISVVEVARPIRFGDNQLD